MTKGHYYRLLFIKQRSANCTEPLFMVDLDTQPEPGKEFDVIRAPSLLLVDGSGKTILKQDEVVTDAQPLELQAFETKMGEVLYGK